MTTDERLAQVAALVVSEHDFPPSEHDALIARLTQALRDTVTTWLAMEQDD